MKSLAALLALTFAVPASALTRDEAIDLARDYCYHDWYCDTCNQSVDASCSTSWASDYGTGGYVGLPYDWGGYMSLAEYDDQLDDCYGAGSHSWHGILWCTSGVDCSGFVSKVWDEGHYTTSSMHNVSYGVSQSDLRRGDAVNAAGSHIVLFTHETDAGGPVFYEASGGASKVRLYVPTSGWSYLSGYDPIRYDNITDGTARGTVSNPIQILSFPYETFDATAGTGSDQIDSYACSPTTDESGPERVYRFNVQSEGTLTATVTDDSGTDVDLHLLSSSDPDDCLQRDDVTVSQILTPGTYYLVADTWCSGGGTEYPGGYTMYVDFTGEGGGGDDDDVADDDDDVADDDTGDDDTGGPDDDTGGPDDDSHPPPNLPAPRWADGDETTGGCECPAAPEPDGALQWVVLVIGGGLVTRRMARPRS
jgi:hypothetical protein